MNTKITQPMPLLWRLRTTLRQQIILTILFTVAGLYVLEKDRYSNRSVADDRNSVVIVSIIWVIVLSRAQQEDFTCRQTLWH